MQINKESGREREKWAKSSIEDFTFARPSYNTILIESLFHIVAKIANSKHISHLSYLVNISSDHLNYQLSLQPLIKQVRDDAPTIECNLKMSDGWVLCNSYPIPSVQHLVQIF